MKRTLLLATAAAVCAVAHSTILRVNNTAGSGAPYATVEAAIEAAQAGDTIMVDGSSTAYGTITLAKRLVLLGPGFDRATNGVAQEGGSSASFGNFTFNKNAAGAVVRGFHITGILNVNASNAVVNRCRVGGQINLSGEASGIVIHQCLLHNFISGNGASYVQVTNNILTFRYNSAGLYNELNDSYIAYNTTTNGFTNIHYVDDVSCTGCTFENNIATQMGSRATNTYVGNYSQEASGRIYNALSTDLEVFRQSVADDKSEIVATKGALAGDDPYVLSGVPAGPVIEDITVPASVERGTTLNVKVKVGVQR